MASFKRPRAAFEADLQALHAPYAFYGTPLPPFDDAARDDGSYVPVWKQEVVDERGRKRLHGAFTGGFSAGYFNTVGSKEGWTPSTFVSSRTNRAKDRQNAPQQRPDDFMDDEDRAEQAESEKLQTAGSYAGLGSTQSELAARDAVAGLFRPPSSATMGARLLQKMGWREGQGIGPKIRRKARGDGGQEDSQESHLFAPEDSRMIAFTRKTDCKGLGYQAEVGLGRATGPPVANTTATTTNEDDEGEDTGPMQRLSIGRPKQPATKKTLKKTGFGVGILNDTGSDEEDPYEMGPKLTYNRVIGGDKKAKTKKKKPASVANPSLASRPVFVSKKEAARKAAVTVRKCHDGRLPLKGFVLSNATELPATTYTPPTIPEGWQSSKTKPSSGHVHPSPYQTTADAAKASTLDPKSRAALLGEAALPGKSVFDYLSTTARDKIAAASGRNNLPAAMNEAPPEGFRKTDAQKTKDLWDMVPALDKETAAAALTRGASGWMPYAEDEAKRDRYRSFLGLRAGFSDKLPERAAGASLDDWVRELGEFAHAARVFRPMTGMMASRFTSSSATPGASPSGAPLLSKPEPKPEDPAETAAKMGMYGPMTRTVLSFAPTRLVCKRFNVKPPAHVVIDPGSTPAADDQTPTPATSDRLELVKKSTLEEMLAQARFKSAGFEGGAPAQAPDVPMFVPKEAAVVDVERNEALEGERPGDAVFKAIFGSDDEDDEDDE